MKRTIRAIDTGLASARRNISITAALAEMHCAGQITDTLRFHLYPRSVLIGRHQNLNRAVATDYCAASGIEIARRVTGGGAVYMNPGILAWDLVVDRTRLGARLTDVMETVCTGMAAGLSRLGLPARFRPLNEIEIAGRKIAGSSGIFMGPTLLSQGTILIDFDIEEMAHALVLLANMRGEHGHELLAARVASLRTYLGYVAEIDEIKRLLVVGLSQALQSTFEPSTLSNAEIACASHLQETELGTEDFVRGSAADLLTSTHAASQSVPGGRLEAHVRLLPGRERRIDQIWITGDFSANPSRLIPDLEAALRGSPINKAPEYALEVLETSSSGLTGATPADIAAVIAAAAKGKPARKPASP